MYPIQTVAQLGPYLKALRRSRGWTQAGLAEALGVSRARVNTIERDPGAVSVAQLHRVLGALGARLGVEPFGAHAGAPTPERTPAAASGRTTTGASGTRRRARDAAAPAADKMAAGRLRSEPPTGGEW